MKNMEDKQFLEMVVKAIVANPNDVVVDRTIDERGVLLTLKLNSQDMGYVIGRQGQNARAIRTLLRLVGAKNNARVTLKIDEPAGSSRGYHRRENVSSVEADVSVDDLKI